MRSLFRFIRDQDGQDLTEYSLGVAFVALLSAAIFVTAGSSTSGIWGQANNMLSGANTSIVSPASPADSGSDNGGSDGGDGGHDHGGDGHGGHGG